MSAVDGARVLAKSQPKQIGLVAAVVVVVPSVVVVAVPSVVVVVVGLNLVGYPPSPAT